MNNQTLMQLLRASRRREIAELREWLNRERKDCLMVTRAHQIAVNPDSVTIDEDKHIAKCPHCAKVVEQLKREHSLTRIPGIIKFPEPIRLSAPQLYAAKVNGTLDVKGDGEEGLTWRLVEDEGQIRFWVRTQAQELAGRGVVYSLYGGEGTVIENSLEMHAEDGWLLAEKVFSKDELYSRLAGECRAVRVRLEANGSA